MKKIFSIILILMQASVFAQDRGGCGGHGGDGYSLEFYRLGKHLVQEISSWKPEDFKDVKVNFSVSQLSNAVERTKIISVPGPLLLNGIPVDAINDTTTDLPTITIDRARWDAMANKRLRKLGVVLHEYLGIVQGLYGHGEWDSYPLSSELMAIYESKLIQDAGKTLQRVESLRTQFTASQKAPSYVSTNEFPMSCVEFSALKGDSTKFIRKNAFILYPDKNLGEWYGTAEQREEKTHITREWIDQDPTEKDDRGQSTIKEFIRATKNGDLITEITTDYKYDSQLASTIDSKRGVLSYLYCSKLGSKALAMTKLMRDSLNPVFDLPKTSDYSSYVSKIKSEAASSQYKKCKESNNKACLKVIEKMDKFTIPYESITIDTAKANITDINKWLETLSGADNTFVIRPIKTLFNHYVKHQTYITALLRLNPQTAKQGIGLDDFVQSLDNKVPLSYETAKKEFQLEFEAVQRSFILSF